MDGILTVLKPPGMTSHDVVARIRRLTGQKRIGHAGTLDPGASGVLVLCLGKATKVVSYISDAVKTYRGEITFGKTTDTQDAFGVTQQEQDASALSLAIVEELIRKHFTGEIYQVPPMVSALKKQGRKLYELAREGREVEREPRKISVYSWDIVDVRDFGSPAPRVLFDVTCSKGTYVRTLCHDLGVKAGYGAYMSFLLRRSVGRFVLDNALTLEEIYCLNENNQWGQALLSLDEGLVRLPAVYVQPEYIKDLLNGKFMRKSNLMDPDLDGLTPGQEVRLKSGDGECLALGRVLVQEDNSESPVIHPFRVF